MSEAVVKDEVGARRQPLVGDQNSYLWDDPAYNGSSGPSFPIQTRREWEIRVRFPEQPSISSAPSGLGQRLFRYPCLAAWAVLFRLLRGLARSDPNWWSTRRPVRVQLAVTGPASSGSAPTDKQQRNRPNRLPLKPTAQFWRSGLRQRMPCLQVCMLRLSSGAGRRYTG